MYPNYDTQFNNKFKEILSLINSPLFYIYPFKVNITEKIKNSDERLKNPDLIICNYYDNFLKKVYGKIPIIICDRMDSVCINGKNYASLINESNVIGLFKEYTFNDVKMNNIEYTRNRYHIHLLEETEKITYKKLQLTDLQLSKIQPVSWNLYQYSFICNKRMYDVSNMSCDKSIDIFYICHSHEKITTLYKHREKIFNYLTEFCKNNKLTCKLAFGENIKSSEYIDHLIKSKICIAPYGLGGRIALDQLALLSKTILIKPFMGYINTNPNIYTSDYMTFFDATSNLCDLGNIITNKLQNYESHKKILDNIKNNVLAFDKSYYTNMFLTNVFNALYKYEKKIHR